MYLGWDEWSNTSVADPAYTRYWMAADDFYCLGPKPVTAVHWWGSWPGYQGTAIPESIMPKAFQIAFWTDAPIGANPDIPYSHPEMMIHEIRCENFHVDFHGWDTNPRTGIVESKFQFTQYLTPEEWFHQGLHDRILWVSIAADWGDCVCNADYDGDGIISAMDFAAFMNCYNVGPDITPGCEWADLNCDGLINLADLTIFQCQFNAGWPDPTCCEDNVYIEPEQPWGWETRPHMFQDDAIRIGPLQEDVPHVGYVIDPTVDFLDPIEEPLGVSWDLSFELGTDPQYIKWEQRFDPDWDLNHDNRSMAWQLAVADEVRFDVLVADDWPCSNDYPITSAEWWGSYLGHNGEPGVTPPLRPAYFLLSIWTDNPVGPANYSTPAEVVWRYKAYDYAEIEVGKEKNGEIVYQYYVNLPPQKYFCQEVSPDGLATIYWFGVAAVYPDGTQVPYNWGWTNHKWVFNDDAVEGFPIVGADPWKFDWIELFDQSGVSADQSFVLETDPARECWCANHCQPCGDYTGDYLISPADAVGLVNAWSPKPYTPCADFNHDGIISPADAVILVNHWSPKPNCPASEGCAP